MIFNENYFNDLFKKAFILIVFTISLQLKGQYFTPPVTNYSIDNYKADNQNWSIDINEKGEVFVANSKGLLKFDGQKWSLFQLPNKKIVRSVFCDNDIVYTGSYEDFGFWKKNKFGEYFYTSIFKNFKEARDVDNEQFWKIFKFNNSIYFRSFARGIYELKKDSLTYINNSQGISNEYVFNNKILVLDRELKIKELYKSSFQTFNFSNKNFDTKKITNLVAKNQNLFYFEKGKGYLFNANKLDSLPKELNDFLVKNTLNKTLFVEDNIIVFGTIKKGLAIFNYVTKKTEYLEKKDGLQNNTVLALQYSKGNLWVALDNGITKVSINTPLSFYKDNSGVLGTVYDVSFYENKYFLASNTGTHSFKDDETIYSLKNSEGQTWGIKNINKYLIANHTDGSFLIEDESFIKKINDVGVYCTVNYDDIILQGTYFGINYLKFSKNGFISSRIENIPYLIDNIVFESKYIIWATHPYRGVFRIKLNETFTKAIEIQSFIDNKNLKDYRTKIYNIKNNIILSNSTKWFIYDKSSGRINEYNKLNFANGKELITNEKEIWLLDKNSKNSLTLLDKNLKDSLVIDISSAKNRLVSMFEKVISKNDSIRILNLNDGFATFNLKKLKNKIPKNSGILIQKAYSKNKKFSIKELENIKLSFDEASQFTIEIFKPFAYDTSLNYNLEGEITSKNKVNEGKITLQNLRQGNYTLFVSNTIDSKKIKLITFTVLPPWYLSSYAKVSYFLVLIGFIYIIFWYSKKRIKNQQLQLKKEYIKRTQDRINKLEKENLKKEISSKERELINSTTSIIKRNEIILSLRGELRRLLQFSNNKIRTEQLIKSSKEKIEDEKEWKIFEDNFKKLHEDFFKRLLTSHPKLTTKDLKLCAYIKMGFNTKEIAPLLGITERGVEVHRYRLRKKLNLNSKESLHSFLLLL